MTGEALLLTREPENVRDKYAVAVIRQVTGLRVNQGAGYGIEVPCLYRRQRNLDRAKEAILKLRNDCLLYSFPHYAVTNCITKTM